MENLSSRSCLYSKQRKEVRTGDHPAAANKQGSCECGLWATRSSGWTVTGHHALTSQCLTLTC